MKGILASAVRHVIGAIGAILAWAATADMQNIQDIATNVQVIIGALMTIGAAGSGIWSKIKAKRALRATALASAETGVPLIQK